MKTAEFGKPVSHLPQPGTCRICHCTEDRACTLLVMGKSGLGDPDGSRTCGWADQSRTLCDNPECIAEAKREIGR